MTSFATVTFITGIQRVVKCVILNFSENVTERLVFISHSGIRDVYDIIPTQSFIAFLKGEGDMPATEGTIRPVEMTAGDIFFDIDSVWNLNYKRSRLLPQLKGAGVRIAAYVYDIIPVTHPQYCHELTVYNFLTYIGAHLRYADIVIASAQSTLDEIWKLEDELGLPHTPGFVSWLGADFAGSASASEKITAEDDEKGVKKTSGQSADENNIDDDGIIPEDVVSAASGKYILVVGTLEPRKNHAYLMDAFNQGLYDREISLIFAGRVGWNVEELAKRIDNDPHKDKGLYFFVKPEDAVIDYLYKHAMAVAFPTHQEGFGLPIVESLQRGTPVFAADIPVLREVGGDYCDYFDNTKPESFVNCIMSYLENTDAAGYNSKYTSMKAHIADYTAVTWKEVAQKIEDALGTLFIQNSGNMCKPKRGIRQMVVLTARDDAIGETLKYVDRYMPFIEEVVLCCPDFAAEKMKASYSGRMHIRVLTDSQVLQGRELPGDHGRRNFMLRCMAMQSDELDEVFIMSDDDYRPLRMIDEGQFVTEDYYRAYYFYNLDEWCGSITDRTSFDEQQYRARDFLHEHHYPTRQYASHQPQVIDRDIYREMIAQHPGIEEMGLCEWDSYFNYAQYKYPQLFRSEPYITMNWPAADSDWRKTVYPSEYVFENYYEHLYREENIFDGLSETLSEKQDEENAHKTEMVTKLAEGSQKADSKLREYIDDFEETNNISFILAVDELDGNICLDIPFEMKLPYDSLVHVPFYYGLYEKTGNHELQLGYCIYEKDVLRLRSVPLVLKGENFERQEGHSYFPMSTRAGVKPIPAGEYRVVFELFDGRKVYSCESRLEIAD